MAPNDSDDDDVNFATYYPSAVHTNCLFLSTLRSQSCHDEEDEDGEEVKSFEVGDQSVCLSVCPHDGLGYKVLCRCLSCFT